VGYLSAEKRRDGESHELDDEIRALGERYGIPTEFTSYLVAEPRFAVNTTSGAPMRRVATFEQAKAAAAQRNARSVAVLDSLSVVAAPRANGVAESTKLVSGRTFTRMGNAWVDVRYRASMPTTKIAPFSNAYFDLLNRLPELRAVLALSADVTVVGRDRAIVVAAGGATNLTNAALSALVAAW
jgi:hypothetical protein